MICNFEIGIKSPHEQYLFRFIPIIYNILKKHDTLCNKTWHNSLSNNAPIYWNKCMPGNLDQFFWNMNGAIDKFELIFGTKSLTWACRDKVIRISDVTMSY